MDGQLDSHKEAILLYLCQIRYYILLVSLKVQNFVYYSNYNNLAMVFLNCYYFHTASCLTASDVHVRVRSSDNFGDSIF